LTPPPDLPEGLGELEIRADRSDTSPAPPSDLLQDAREHASRPIHLAGFGQFEIPIQWQDARVFFNQRTFALLITMSDAMNEFRRSLGEVCSAIIVGLFPAASPHPRSCNPPF
jgi:hypothetical protein